MKLFLLCLLLATFCFSAKAQDTPADNWSQFRGNQRLTGVSQSAVPRTIKHLWTYEAGDSIESSAAIVGGTVFVGSQKGELAALNLENGSVYWKYSTGNPIGELRPPLTVAACYIGDLGGVLHAVNAPDGKGLWTFKAGNEIKSSPVVVGDRVLIGSYDQHLYCLSTSNGSVIWKVKTNRPVHSTPGILPPPVWLSLPAVTKCFVQYEFLTAKKCLVCRPERTRALHRLYVEWPLTTAPSTMRC